MALRDDSKNIIVHWNEQFDQDHQPTLDQVTDFIDSPLWVDLTTCLQETYKAKQILSYSKCAMDSGNWMGWNIKFKKSGKILCTVYPKQGYLMVLIPVSNKNLAEADLLTKAFSDYTKDIYQNTPSHHMGKSLALEVTDAAILDDLKELITLRV